MSSNNRGDNKDPWGGGDRKEGPPDLDRFFKELTRKLSSLGAKHKGSFGMYGNPQNLGWGAFSFVSLIFIVVLFVWMLSGFFIVGPAKQAVILRLGKYSKTQSPGLHWFPRLIDSKKILNIQKISSYEYTSDMLTQDENIVNVSLVVQYRIANPRDYLFNVIHPYESLQQATASALRQVVGNMSLDDVLTKKRSQVREQAKTILKSTLTLYRSGIEVTDVVLQPTKPPEQVTAAFDDAIKAREDEQRFINQAMAYGNSVVPIARGKAKRLLQAAKAEQQQLVLNSKAKTVRFSALLPIYKKAPTITRNRMYIDAIQSVLEKSSTVLVDLPKGNHVIYLPLNQLMTPKDQQNNVEQRTKNIEQKEYQKMNQKIKVSKSFPSRRGDRFEHMDRGL